MPFDKVQPGEPMRIPASTYNSMVDAAQDFQQRRRGVGADPLKPARYEGTVRVRNDTGSHLFRFSVVGLGEVVITQSDNPQSFYSRPTFVVERPEITAALKYGKHVAKVAVIQEPIREGAIGWAKISGLTPVKVNVQNNYDDIAILQDSSSGVGAVLPFVSSTVGQSGASILWHEADATGVQWCLVLLGNFRSKFASMYRATLDGTLTTSASSITVDNLVPMNGLEHIDITTLEAFNIFTWEAADNATALVVWNNHTGLKRWELIQLDCG